MASTEQGPTKMVSCPAGCGLVPQNHFTDNMAFHIEWVSNKIEDLRLKLNQVADGGTNSAAIDKQISEMRAEIDALATSATLVEQLYRLEGTATRLQGGIRDLQVKVQRSENEMFDKRNTEKKLMKRIKELERQNAMADMRRLDLCDRLKEEENVNNDGTLIWKIDGVARKIKEAKDGQDEMHLSVPFFTDKYGYKMCVQLFLNGSQLGHSTHISIFLMIMRGRYNAILDWPFKPQVSFCLISQIEGGEHVIDQFIADPSSASFQRPKRSANLPCGNECFVRLEDLENPAKGFIKDDTLFIKVAVSTEA